MYVDVDDEHLTSSSEKQHTNIHDTYVLQPRYGQRTYTYL